MKAVLISIQPYWVFLIIAKLMGWNINKEKTVEVRKSRPKDENWNKVTKIYCSKDKKSFDKIPKEYRTFMKPLLGKVIGEFVCDRIDEIYQCNSGWVSENACISKTEFFDYLGIPRETHMGYDKKAYAWHISELVIYDKPKELSEFYHACKQPSGTDCSICHDRVEQNCWQITRPPQSWCYVEERW